MSRKVGRLGFVALASALVMGACGDDETERICQAYARAACDWTERCAARSFTRNFDTEAECIAGATVSCSVAAKLPGSSRTFEFSERCAEAFTVARCDDPLTDCYSGPGTLRDGEACMSGYQCGAGRACVFPTELHVELGCGECEFFWNEALPDGEACTERWDCDSRFCQRGFCAPRPGIGQDCSGAEEGFDPCELGEAECVDGICTELPLANPGEPCTVTQGWAPANCRKGYCDTGGIDGPGVCLAWKRAGEPCDNWAACGINFICHAGTCIRLSAKHCG